MKKSLLLLLLLWAAMFSLAQAGDYQLIIGEQVDVCEACKRNLERMTVHPACERDYSDQQGSRSFNKILGMKRAETVKQHLIALGVPESSIRTVSLGEEGALCIDNSDVCKRMNRRVHVEMRKIGQEHMVVSPVAPETAADPFSNNLDLSIEAGQSDASDASNGSLPLTTSEPAERTSEPTDGN